MRVTRQKLVELAREEAQRRATSGAILSAYLIGSVAQGEPLLGETADIDMILIHEEPPPRRREIVRLSHQIHFDIAHHHKQEYKKPSQLRTDPWLGPALCEPIFLYDPEHFFEWAQAGARGQYYRADHVYARALAFLGHARQQASLLPISDRWERAYLNAVLNAANSIASLHKFPVAGRRLTQALKSQSNSLDMAEVYSGFLKLIGADRVHDWSLTDLYQPWTHAFDTAIQLNGDELLVECRKEYFLQGFQALSENNQQKAVIWPLLYTWERSMHAISTHSDDQRLEENWQETLALIGMDAANRSINEAALLEYIQLISTRLEQWASENGA